MQNNFGYFLKERRLEKNLTQKQLAVKLFVSESAVSKWEKGNSHPDITLLPKLSEILGVSEHELITSSIDNRAREDKRQAKKWRALSLTWSLFFYIAYGIALLTCFIVNLAVEGTLSWFFIVVSALLLSATFTVIPKFIKRYRLMLIPLSMYLSLCLLLGVLAIYTHGAWFFVATMSVLLGLTTLFSPIYLCKYNIFSKLKKYTDFISVAVDFIVLNALLIIINSYTNGTWYFNLALPIASGVYLILNLFLCVRFLRINKLLKTSIILFASVIFFYLPPLFLKVSSQGLQKEIDDINILKANFTVWDLETIDNNVHLIVCLTAIFIVICFFVAGLLKNKLKKKKESHHFP